MKSKKTRKKKVKKKSSPRLKAAYTTPKGRMFHGDSKLLLTRAPLTRSIGKVQLIFTSPPFPLARKKSYGNLNGDEYIKWLASFGPLLRNYLTSNGSLVVELGNAWESGTPTMSTWTIEALLALKKAGNFHLCQEFICFNPARLPSPAQWVNVKRSRVKDAFTRVWWLSRVARPKADNRRVLTEYSDSMKKLLERGTYNPGIRPSEHDIGRTSFLKRHKGAIVPNVLTPSIQEMLPELYEVLAIANTSNGDAYQTYIRERGIEIHPARMPKRLVEFFVRFLTTRNDLVLDPFAGSNTTGAVAQSLGRKWISLEANKTYVTGSRARFMKRFRK
jgi:DNA modification methylase